MKTMVIHRKRRALRVLGVVIVVAACAGGSGDSGAAGNGGEAGGTTAAGGLADLDACALFTAADASEVLGAPAEQPDRYTRLDRRDEQMGVALSNCLYSVVDGNRSVHVVIRYQSAGGMPTSFAELKQPSEASAVPAEITAGLLDSSVEVTGIGTVAYWTPEIATLTVIARDHYLISTTGDSPVAGDIAASRSIAEAMAQKILARL